jgi:pimeloyl-ACP methyl ester carboxylesterase
MPHFQSHDAAVHFQTIGSGAPLLLIAGTASDGASWGPLVPALSARFQLILIDNRGSGQTRHSGPISINDMVVDCANLLDHLGIASAAAVGHSLGGAIGLRLAARHPARVNRVVTLTAGAPDARSRALFHDLARLYPDVQPQLFFRLLYQFLFKPAFFENPDTLLAAAEASTNYPYRQSPADFSRQVAALDAVGPADLTTITAPVLAIAAELDRLMTPEAVFSGHSGVPNLRTTTIPRAGHSIHWDATEAVLAAVLPFLTETARP